MEQLLIFWFFAIIGYAVLRNLIKKKLGIDKEEKAGVRVKKFEFWNSGISVSIIIVLILVFYNSLSVLLISATAVFVVGNTVQIFLEWKYLKGSRKYVLSFVDFAFLAIWMIAIYVVIYVQII
ncbi:hypothetical protein Plano_2788 [Planococcus sp. PAMC 21323]|uniref:DUF4181 domain-containing protein n=1 Tax=Planococcus sp. PAMC 21323 TaxID=1526927 RepID=UPI00056F4D8B|nr:DUF4181 domain-containing protein [Planococcus sp. PAMC 21323]AIY06753.1 hypothetical protein Plano_2788 [Planococcus sp. PAMC 21323]